MFNQNGDQMGFKFVSDELKAVETEGVTDKYLVAPMPGTISKISKNVGDIVKKGESIIVMEAMKM